MLVPLIIQGYNQADRALQSLQSALGGIGRSAKGAGDEGKAAGESMFASFLNAQLAVKGIESAIGLVQGAFGKLQGSIAESTNLQLENITAAQTLQAVAGNTFKSYDDASAFVDKLNTRLAKSAAALPGATKDYNTLARTIQDNVVDAFKGADGSISDINKFEDTLAGLSESYGVLSAASNVPIQNTALGLTKALGGASVAELRQIQAFEQNPAILNAIEKRLKDSGAKSLGDLNIQSRVQLLQEVGTKFVSEDMKKRAAGTVDGLMQSFISSINDPTTGIFGLMRPVQAATGQAKTAFEAYNKLINSLVGSGGLTDAIGKVLESFGLSADTPMTLLRNAIEWLNGNVQFLTGIVNQFSASFKSAGTGLSGIVSNIGAAIAFFVDSAGNLFKNAISGLGERLAQAINSLLGGVFNSIAGKGIDMGPIGSVLQSLFSNVVIPLFQELGSFLANLDPKVYAAIAAGLLGSAALAALGTLAAGLLAAFIASTAGFPVLLTVAAVFAVGAAVKALIDAWGDVTAVFESRFNVVAVRVREGISAIVRAAGTFFDGVVSGVSGAVNTGVALASNAITGFFQWIGGIWDSIKNAIISNPVVQSLMSAAQATANTVGVVTSPVQGVISTVSAIAAPVQGAASTVGGALSGAGSLLSGALGAVLPKFAGNIPNAAGGLLGAAIAESRAMPSGASLVVANSSETIIPRGASLGRPNSFSIGAININGVQDAGAIADQIIAEIQSRFEAAMNAQLS